MGPDISKQPHWRRTLDGDVDLQLIEEWRAGVTEHGDIALCFTSSQGADPDPQPEQKRRAQFICTREDAKLIARMILGTLASSEPEAPGFEAFREKIKSPALRALADDWNAARGSRRMASFNDIKPGSTAPYLGGIWAFDYHRESGKITGRLAGASITLGYTREYRGASLSELYLPHVRELAEAHLMRVMNEPACVLYSGKIFRRRDVVIEGERLILPMGDDPDRPDGVLGATHFESHPLSHAQEPIEFISDTADWHRL